MREEGLAHRGNPDHLPRSKGSAEARVTQGRRKNRSVFVQATPGTGVREHRSRTSKESRGSIEISSDARANLAVDYRHARMPYRCVSDR